MNIAGNNWEKVKQLFQAVLDLDPPKRADFLDQHCPDPDLRRQVEHLLSSYRRAGSFLEHPAIGPRATPSVTPAPDEEQTSNASPGSANSSATETATAAHADDPMVGRQFGAYKLIRRIGEGGMAAVYLAERADDEFRKQVAVKIVQPGLDHHDLLNRFRMERQTLAGLDHPNVIKLLDGGSTPEGLPFLVMDYVEGSPIDDYCDGHRLCVDERLQVFTKVCEAVQYAHERGVVHRDLKPGNILVTTNGVPKLLDFGIAKVLNPESSSGPLFATQTGMRCMTPAYASPEQMRGKPVTPATDIYSLGVVLYELLSGHRPYRLTQHTPAEIERAICDQDPETPSTAVNRVESETSASGLPITKTPEIVSQTREGQPEKLRRRLRGDLDNIVLKALQKEPGRRYDSVGDFSRDIERHLQHLPVAARRSTLAYRASKFAQRHRFEVGSTFLIIFSLLLAASFAFNPLGFRDRVIGLVLRTGGPSRLVKGSVNSKLVGGAGLMPAVSCDSLADLKLPDTTITSSQIVPGGGFTPPQSDPMGDLPPFCRLEGAIRPSPDSDIRFEVWMPASGWNSKLRGIGNWGFGGSITYGNMGPPLRNGYAVVATDTGHIAERHDLGWALGHPEKLTDFGYRAVHAMTESAKAAIRKFYGEAPRASFFEGCSNGGREGLMEAERFPQDYQGILVGSPVINATHALTAALYNMPSSRAAHIPPNKIPAIAAAVIAACDAQDGVRDGILNEPRKCHFDPDSLLCQGTESDGCLTKPQAAHLKEWYSGLRDTKGELLYPGYLPGGEEGEGGWGSWLEGKLWGQATMSVYGMNFYRNIVFEDLAWDYHSVSAQKALEIADAKTGGILNATDPDLRRFKAQGGKLIIYHGWSDPGIPTLATTNYYDQVAASTGKDDVGSFVRLYLAPGMQHCGAGAGPNFFGQFDMSSLGTDNVATTLDPQHNIFSALEQWVEKGVAPGPIVATKFVDDLDPSQGVKLTRPLCPYPQIAKYKGTGDTNSAANFACVAPDQQP